MASNHTENKWIQDIARSEVIPELDVLQGIAAGAGPQQWVEESTVDFLTDLRCYLQEYIKIFNDLSEGGKKFQEVKIFNLTQGAADFMLYRNGVKLIVTNVSHGVIEVSFQKHQNQAVYPNSPVGAPTDPNSGLPSREEILAQVGAFGKVYWTYRSERVNSEEVARHFFAQFTRVTREQKKLKPNQQQLLQQIKTMLKENGLEL